jgi:hypothetical protein
MTIPLPYKDPIANQVYNLMFCDKPNLYREWNAGPTAVIFAQPLNERAVRALADDKNEESRTRALAFNRLKNEGKSVPPGKLLGVIVEAALDRGLDVLAAYGDGRIRYINATEKMALIEQNPPSLRAPRENLFKVSEDVLGDMTPTKLERPGPPPRGQVRLSLVVSDGLYVGQADTNALSQDYLGGPILRASNELLNAVVEFAKKNSA